MRYLGSVSHHRYAKMIPSAYFFLAGPVAVVYISIATALWSLFSVLIPGGASTTSAISEID
jgi:hypothetical protein